MKKFVIAFITLLLAGVGSIGAREVKGFATAKGSTGNITFRVTSVDYRTDLTRVYGQFVGRPHTSERVDELLLILPNGKALRCNDIEGVDLKRWFQWEDNGSIDVELDFPPMREQSRFTLKSTGPKGESRSSIVKTK